MTSKKLTPVEWLVEQVNQDCLNSIFIRPELASKALQLEKDFYEIPNDSIEKAATKLSFFAMPKVLFEYGAKWYKEQIQNKNRDMK
jgi:hypothetical protein